MPDLADLQSALQAAVIQPGEASWRAAAAGIAPGRMTPQRRLSLYARGYRARLLECLRGEYPALLALMGEEVFCLFAGGYLDACPSTSATLHHLGARFPDWLAAGRPAGTTDGELAALPASLARLERTWSEAMRAEGPEMSPAPPNDLLLRPGGRLRLPSSSRLLRLDFDFAPLMAAVAEGAPAPAPVPRQTLAAVARGGYRVRLLTLGAPRFAWLEALGRDGDDVQAAAARAAQVTDTDPGALLADLILWLPLAVQAGLVAAA